MKLQEKVFVLQAEKDKQKQYIDKCKAILQERYANHDVPLAYVHSYGCQQNVSDGEKIKGMLAQVGYGFTDSPDHAQLVLYNTCAIRENAEDRVFGNVGALKHYKRRNPNMLICLCGCMMQQQHIADKIKKSYPHVGLVFGTHVLHQFPQLLYEALTQEARIFNIQDSEGVIAEGLPVKRDGTLKAWLPIMYGCNNYCTYCIVPYVRGRERSRRAEDVVAEAQQIVAEGYKEITLLGQNVNSYGKGLDEEIDFSGLLRRINDIDGDFRIRFMTSHPKDANTKLIDTIAECDKICNHLHLPIQSGSNRVLKRMNRSYTRESYLELIRYAREKIPSISFTSDIIVGFPGEQYEDFQQTLDLIKTVKYDSLYTFIYSKRVGTRAETFEDLIPSSSKAKWFQEMLDVQKEIGAALYEKWVGKTVRVLVDGVGKTGDGYMTGRTENNVIVDFSGSKTLIGKFVNIKITKALNWAVIGELV